MIWLKGILSTLPPRKCQKSWSCAGLVAVLRLPLELFFDCLRRVSPVAVSRGEGPLTDWQRTLNGGGGERVLFVTLRDLRGQLSNWLSGGSTALVLCTDVECRTTGRPASRQPHLMSFHRLRTASPIRVTISLSIAAGVAKFSRANPA